MFVREDLAGKVFGKLTVIDYAYTKKEKVHWNCVCSCGNKTTVCASSLKLGRTKSCGCYRNEESRKRLAGLDRTNFLPAVLPAGVSAFNHLYYRYKSAAKYRGLLFDLNAEYFLELTSGNCFYCGKEPSQKIFACSKNAISEKYRTEYIYNGIDRIDSTKGYILGNVVSCCGQCNKAKYRQTTEDFFDWVKRIYEYNFR